MREHVLQKVEISNSETKQGPKISDCQSVENPEVDENGGEIDNESYSINRKSRNCDQKYHNEECSICMEEFKVGETVSFSPAEGCYHVFHHDCLRQWLLHKIGCPCCRVIMLPVDQQKPKEQDEGERPTNGQLLQLESSLTKKQQNQRNTKAFRHRLTKKQGIYCCISCGVVELETALQEDLHICKAISNREASGRKK